MTSSFAGNPEYRLVWPHAVLRAELRWLVAQPSLDVEAAKLVLREAFHGDEPHAALVERSSGVFGTPQPGSSPRGFLAELLAELDQLPVASRSAPLWHERRGVRLPVPPGVSQPPQPTLAASGERFDWTFVRFVRDLWEAGYFRQAVPKVCVDADAPGNDPDFDMDMTLWELLGVRGLWPLEPQRWNDDTRWALVEALGDLVARPRQRHWHSWDGCGWHCSNFSISTGQLLYRSRVNAMLEASGVPLRLADEGEDIGRLVRLHDEAREDLVERAVATPAATDRDEITHAIALFRARTADRENKRSAVVALARVLEDRRSLLKRRLFRKDEGALFEIANSFDLRHRDDKQHPDYDEAFVDWVFWWYLATIELTDSLLARQDAP